MRIGAVFPQNEIPADRDAVRATALGIEEVGFNHVVAFDHVVGADPVQHPEGPGLLPTTVDGSTWAYTDQDPFHEPLVLFSFIAALTKLELVTGVLVLPQRQATLVAKQAAEVDVLSGGRLRLGVGSGWNAVEYEALGQDFADRAARMEEQIALMRALWTRPVLTFSGQWHEVNGAGINPLPVQRPIPVWIGARPRGRALRRIGILGDGWITMDVPGPRFDAAWQEVRAAAERAGRDPDSIGLEGRVSWADGDIGRIRAESDGWRERGAGYVSVSTLRGGLRGVDQHLAALAAAFEVMRG